METDSRYTDKAKNSYRKRANLLLDAFHLVCWLDVKFDFLAGKSLDLDQHAVFKRSNREAESLMQHEMMKQPKTMTKKFRIGAVSHIDSCEEGEFPRVSKRAVGCENLRTFFKGLFAPLVILITSLFPFSDGRQYIIRI